MISRDDVYVLRHHWRIEVNGCPITDGMLQRLFSSLSSDQMTELAFAGYVAISKRNILTRVKKDVASRKRHRPMKNLPGRTVKAVVGKIRKVAGKAKTYFDVSESSWLRARGRLVTFATWRVEDVGQYVQRSVA